jgi:hypothetical protein
MRDFAGLQSMYDSASSCSLGLLVKNNNIEKAAFRV